MSDRKKRQDLPVDPPAPAGLWVVATPLGNLSDLSARCAAALSSCDTILCEDTRRTQSLLAALGIRASTARLDAHAKPKEIERWVEALRVGESLALVTDAGTPAISDPGAALVEAALLQGVRVTPIPGPSAVVTLLSVSGFKEAEFSFLGFFPRSEGDQKKLLDQISSHSLTRVYVWYESPHRIVESLARLAERFPNSRLCVGKELTKIHEVLFCGTSQEVSDAVRRETEVQGCVGEWCFALNLASPDQQVAAESSDWVKALECLIEVGISPSQAAKQISHKFGTAKNQVYARALTFSGRK